MKRKLMLLMVVMTIASLVASCVPPPQASSPAPNDTAQEAQPAPTEKVLNCAITTEPISIDAHVGNDATTSMALNMSFEGLLNNVNGQLVPGMAEKYEVSEDGTVYTFHLRDAKWSDGKAVTAQDFADTYKRMLTRKDSMDLAYLIFPMKNAQPVNEGKADVSTLGVKAIDDKTLEVTLEAPYPFMKSLFAFCSLLPIRVDLLEKYGKDYGSAPDKIAQNGPYLLTEWARNDKLVYVKNPDYWNKDAVKIEKVVLNVVPDPNTQKNMFDTGEILFMSVSPDLISTYEKDPGFAYFEKGGVQFIVLSQKATSSEKAKIIKNRNFIMALSYAIDRTAFVKAMFPMHSPFTGIINPAISTPVDKKWNELYDVTNKYHSLTADETKAKEYMAAACKELGYKSVEDMPAFDYMTTDAEVNKTVGEYFQDVWSRVLGIKIEIRQLQFAQYYENLYSKPYDIALSGWGPDYDDPFTYLDMWNDKGGWNKTGWGSEKYNKLITDANKQSDMSKRNEMFAEAEKILLTEAPMMPVYANRGAYIVNPKLAGMYINSFGTTFDFRYADLNQ